MHQDFAAVEICKCAIPFPYHTQMYYRGVYSVSIRHALVPIVAMVCKYVLLLPDTACPAIVNASVLWIVPTLGQLPIDAHYHLNCFPPPYLLSVLLTPINTVYLPSLFFPSCPLFLFFLLLSFLPLHPPLPVYLLFASSTLILLLPLSSYTLHPVPLVFSSLFFTLLRLLLSFLLSSVFSSLSLSSLCIFSLLSLYFPFPSYP